MDLWEIVIPCHWNFGTAITKEEHEKWDAKVCEITEGLMLHGKSI